MGGGLLAALRTRQALPFEILLVAAIAMPRGLRADQPATPKATEAPQAAPAQARVEQFAMNRASTDNATAKTDAAKTDAARANAAGAAADSATADSATANSAAANSAAANSAAVLIQRLGDDQFEVREEASRRLSQMGIEIQPALDVAIQNPDPEVRVRARRIRDTIRKEDLERRVNEFAQDVHDSKHLDLPGWVRFKQIAGDSEAARRLFVDMQRAEPALFRSLEDGPAAASIALQNCIAQNWARSIQRARYTGVTVAIGSAAAFVFVGADKQLTIGDDVAVQLVNMVNQGSFREAINNPSQAKPIKKLLGAWVARNASNTILVQNLWVSIQYELKEGVDLANTVLRQGNQPAYVKQSALMVIAKMGNKDQLPAVELCMKDGDVVGNGAINNQQVETQVRDVALAVEIHIYGQDPKTFGYNHSDMMNGFPFYNPMMMGFRSGTDRDAAFKKWANWLDENHKKGQG